MSKEKPKKAKWQKFVAGVIDGGVTYEFSTLDIGKERREIYLLKYAGKSDKIILREVTKQAYRVGKATGRLESEQEKYMLLVGILRTRFEKKI